MRCYGQGTVYLANLAQHVHVMDVDQDGLTVDSTYVLALDSSLHYEVIAVDSQYGISGSGQVPAQHLRPRQGRPDDLGRAADDAGHARTSTSTVDADAVVAWSTSPAGADAGARRTPPGCGGGAATPARAGSCSFLGTGYRAGPAQRAAAAAERPDRPGLRRAVRHGPAGLHAQNQGNVWN